MREPRRPAKFRITGRAWTSIRDHNRSAVIPAKGNFHNRLGISYLACCPGSPFQADSRVSPGDPRMVPRRLPTWIQTNDGPDRIHLQTVSPDRRRGQRRPSIDPSSSRRDEPPDHRSRWHRTAAPARGGGGRRRGCSSRAGRMAARPAPADRVTAGPAASGQRRIGRTIEPPTIVKLDVEIRGRRKLAG